MKKEHQIIMLPSRNDFGCIGIRQKDGMLQNLGHYNVEVNFNWEAQHLYILSDEEIKEGDWFVNLGSGGHPRVAIYKANSENSKAINEFKFPEIKKIIATTDTELNKVNDENKVDESWFRPIIPKIPKHIIKAYVKKPFDKVLVEYDTETIVVDNLVDLIRPLSTAIYEQSSHTIIGKPKLNQDGTLAVSLVEKKKIWAKNVSTIHHGEQWTPYTKYGAIVFGEVAQEMKTFKSKEECEQWIKENL